MSNYPHKFPHSWQWAGGSPGNIPHPWKWSWRMWGAERGEHEADAAAHDAGELRAAITELRSEIESVAELAVQTSRRLRERRR